ncbi:CHASE2 domain-containing protein [Pseudoalteromonas distincta]|uniref:CHASE2 domain-containing protein n=1 Tax=Pseudoalteromonas distincta TaxID=77608 RepID=UPI0027D93CB2|nr:adenylate/guanylate cyclase domain-containing protein [Pseudoalteromonas elyakovii]
MSFLKPITSKHFFIGTVITLLIASIELFSTGSLAKLVNRVEGIIYDSRLLLTLSETPRRIDETVVIIDIDEKSMQEQGRFPWSRSKLADLVTKLSDAGVIVIAFDIFFSEQEENPVTKIMSEIPDLSKKYTIPFAEITKQVDADTKLASALSKNDTVLGFLLIDEQLTNQNLPAKNSVVWASEEHANSQINQFPGAIVNIPQLQNAATGTGFINAHIDEDGFIRKAALINRVGDKLYPSLALEVARLYTLAENIETRSNRLDGITLFEGIKFQNKWIQTDEYGQILIPYKGRAHSFPYYSATDILTKKIGLDELEGTVAFIGTSAVGLADLRSTPVGLQYPGVEVHANIFEGLMHPELLPSKPNWSQGASLLIIALTGCVLSFFSHAKSARFIIVLSLTVTSVVIFLNVYLWSVQKISLPLLMPLLLIIILAGYYIIVGSIAEMKHSRKIKSMFDQYVPPERINQMILQGKSLSQKSERKNMTVLFADIRSFTSLSESMSPHQLSEYLNEYLTAITKIIFDHHGTIDKYVGDMVMAFWNAPLKDENHARHGVEAAMSMIHGLTKINQLFAENNQPAIKIGIGLSTGDMNVGDMGSVYRKAYTVLGDTVNLGARVESLTKFYGVAILVTEETMKKCPHISFRLIDKVQVVGKTAAVQLFEPINFTDKLNEEQLNEVKKSQQAMTLFYNKNWPQALSLFKELHSTTVFSPNIYAIFIERIKGSDLQTLAKDWNGAFKHTQK